MGAPGKSLRSGYGPAPTRLEAYPLRSMTSGHLIDGPPVWTMSDEGGFTVACMCGWTSPLYDTQRLAAAAGEDHVVAAGLGDAAAAERSAPGRRRWFRRS